MRLGIVLALALSLLSSIAFGRAAFKDARLVPSKGAFKATLEFDEPVTAEAITVDYINSTIQVDIPDAFTASKKLTRVDGREDIKSLFTYQPDPGYMRTRVIYQPNIQASSFRDRVEIVGDGNKIHVLIHDTAPQVAKSIPVVPPIALGDDRAAKDDGPESILEKELGLVEEAERNAAVEEKTEQEKKPVKVAEADIKIAEPKKESEIPVLVASAKKDTTSSGVYWRMVVSLVVVLGLAIASMFVARWWSRKYKTNSLDTKISVLTQHHIGPKKTLAIVRVAGETILIGITDHNISMLKTLALIDDEFPEEVPSKFSDSLKQASDEAMSTRYSAPDKPLTGKKKPQPPSEDSEDFSFGHIKDRVATRLKEMRHI